MEILERVAQGQGTDRDAAALHDIGFTMTAASLCGLGMTAGTAVLSALKRWPELFGVHAGG
jgi:NADH-quinone oxidoreductase subunit F